MHKTVPALEMANVSVFTGEVTTYVLPLAANLVVYRGEAVVLIAGSGQERDLWFECAALLSNIATGLYKINGERVDDLSDSRKSAFRAQIGVISNRIPLIEDLSIESNVAVPFVYSQLKTSVRDATRNAMDYVGIGDHGNDMPSSLGVEELQLAAIARSIAVRPSLLLVYDPSGESGQALTDAALRVILRAHSQRGLATVFVTSRQNDELAKLCDRVVYSGGAA